MNTSMLKAGARQLSNTFVKNSPTILTGLGVAGVFSTVALAVRATPKALYILEEEKLSREKKFLEENKDELNFDEKDAARKISIIDIVKLTWKDYIPSALMGGATIACIIGANSINLRRNAVLASLYSLSETALKEYQAKVIETIGKNKEEKIHESLIQDKLDKDPVTGKQVIVTGKGEVLCYDSLSGRYFKSDMETIRRIQNDFNARIIHDNYRQLNELYDDLGLEPTAMGRDVGWTTDCLLEIKFTSKIATDGQPCMVLEYKPEPRNI